ncbi:beta-propeller fold lactonase family protein [Edaphobacter paludis]|uniref:Beta-propeller fold lactonase family protein n=1 Tax=Edaphobacter paludis TaxID=3035702 RepID=A0AAU7CX00_9BACT
MKLNNIGRGALASILSLAVGLGVTACSRDYTLAYVYVTTAAPLSAGSSTDGGVSAFAVDYQSGALTPLADSPIPAGKKPVTLVAGPASANGQFIYVVNHDDSTVMEFSIGTDGKLYLKNTYNTTGSLPTAAAIDAAGTFLYVTNTYQNGPNNTQLYTPASPGPGSVTIFPINKDGSLGTPATQNVGNLPVAIVASKLSNYVYVLDQENATTSPLGVILGYSENSSNGALTPTAGGTVVLNGVTVGNGYPAGTTPSAIAEDPSARFVYVTDKATNQLYGYLTGTGGALTTMTNGPFSTGTFPVSVTIDPRGKYMYVANYNDNTVSAYAIDVATGAPVSSTGSATTNVGTTPTCIAIEPAKGQYLYVSNYLDGTITGESLNSHNGGLTAVQNTPFPSSGLPTCAVAVANGSYGHPNQIINP